MRKVSAVVREKDATQVCRLFRLKYGVGVAAVKFVAVADRRQLQADDAVYPLQERAV